MMNRRIHAQLAGVFLLLGASGNALAIDWLTLDPNVNVQPPKWDWQLKSPVQLNDDETIGIYDVDMFDNETTGVVAELQSYGKKVICYVNVGAWEDFRDDEADFPRSILGNVYDRFPNEKWLDIRDVNPSKSNTGLALTRILEARFDRAKQIGCDAVEPDNIDGYDVTSHNPSGFPLTYEDQMYFNAWVSREVRERGMAIGFKNNTNQALDPRTVEAFDFVVTESCVLFDECQYFTGFLDAGKPVFLTEYLLEPEQFCQAAKDLRISAIKKRFSLDDYRLNCNSYYTSQPEPEPEPNPAATNLLVNGDFETGVFQWNPCGGLDNISVSSNAAQGTKALGFIGDAGCVYQDIPVSAGKTYALSCEATRTGTPWSIVQLSYLDEQYNNIATTIKQVATGGGYANYTLESLAPPNTKHAVALLYSEDEMLVDNCSLYDAAEPAPIPEPQPEPEPIATNLLANGGFEQNLREWQSCASADSLAISRSASQGNKSLEITGAPGCLYQEVPVTVGVNYTLSCDASRQGTPWSIVQLSYLDSGYNNLNTKTKQIATGGSYSTYTLNGTAPANTTFAVALLYSEDQTLIDNCVLSSN